MLIGTLSNLLYSDVLGEDFQRDGGP